MLKPTFKWLTKFGVVAAILLPLIAQADPLEAVSLPPALGGPQLTLQELIDKSTLEIEDVIQLPINSIAAVSDNEGTIMFIADSGRYAIHGSLIDIWEGEVLTTMAEIKASVTKMDLRGQGIDVDKLNIASFGHGPREIIVFVDPVCPTCTNVLEDAEKLSDLYTFKFVVVPAFGGLSNHLSKQFFCAANPDERFEALKNGTIADLATKENCPLDYYDQTLVLAHMLSIDGVPFIISQKDKQYRGRPADLGAWLEKN